MDDLDSQLDWLGPIRRGDQTKILTFKDLKILFINGCYYLQLTDYNSSKRNN